MSLLLPIVGIDLGPLALCCTLGTWNAPLLLKDPEGKWELRECGDEKGALGYIAELTGRRGRLIVARESTFSAGTKRYPWLREVGREQEAQGRWLEAKLESWPEVVEVVRVQPQIDSDGRIAWEKFGYPTLRGPRLGEHYRDSLAVALACMCKLEDDAKAARMEVVG